MWSWTGSRSLYLVPNIQPLVRNPGRVQRPSSLNAGGLIVVGRSSTLNCQSNFLKAAAQRIRLKPAAAASNVSLAISTQRPIIGSLDPREPGNLATGSIRTYAPPSH